MELSVWVDKWSWVSERINGESVSTRNGVPETLVRSTWDHIYQLLLFSYVIHLVNTQWVQYLCPLCPFLCCVVFVSAVGPQNVYFRTKHDQGQAVQRQNWNLTIDWEGGRSSTGTWSWRLPVDRQTGLDSTIHCDNYLHSIGLTVLGY